MELYHKGRKIQRVGFVGFGISNVALFNYFKSNFTDLEFSLRLPREAKQKFAGRVYEGKNYLSDIHEDVLFFSPSVKREGDFKNAICSSEVEFFFEKNHSRAFAVSGSDGKSTTSTLAKLLLGDGCVLGGNIGTPLCEFLGHKEDVVCELSSFQLNYFSPNVLSAVITSISENHLDYHGSFAAYVSAKENLLKGAKFKSIWADGEVCRELIKKHNPQRIISYNHDFEYLRKTYDAESYITEKNGIIMLNGVALANARRLYNFGEHTLKNFMSALSLTLFEDVKIDEAICSFSPLSHRCTLVKSEGGIDYFDSSVDSSPERTKTTLASFNNGVVLILGGRDKGLDFSPLIPEIARCVIHCITYGESGEKIKNFLEKSPEIRRKGIGLDYFQSFEDSVEFAKSIATAKNKILLSPACASYDQFENFESRAAEFIRIINKN